MENIRRLPIHRALIRPILLAGGERKLVMLNYTLIAVLLLGAGLNTLTIITALLLATAGHMGLVQLARYDAQLMQIYLRYRYYSRWYSAQATIYTKNHPVRPAVLKGARP